MLLICFFLFFFTRSPLLVSFVKKRCPVTTVIIEIFLKESIDSGLAMISSLTQWPWEHKTSDKNGAYVPTQFLSGGIIL